MPRVCQICQHTEREAIDKALASGDSLRGIARTYFGSVKAEDALGRHKAEHLPLTIAKAEAAKQVEQARGIVAEGLDVVAQLRAINQVTLQVMKDARDSGDRDMVLKAVDRVERQITLQAKLLGELDERPQVNIHMSQEYIEVRTILMRALDDFPEARAAAAMALQGVHDGR